MVNVKVKTTYPFVFINANVYMSFVRCRYYFLKLYFAYINYIIQAFINNFIITVSFFFYYITIVYYYWNH